MSLGLALSVGIASLLVAPAAAEPPPVPPSACVVGSPEKPFLRFTLGPDMSGDGRGEVLAVDSAGVLWEYPGQIDGTLPFACRLGAGFADVDVYGAGDLDSDGQADILGITPDGGLWLYAGRGAAPLPDRVQVGSGWTGWRLIPVGDVNGDKTGDLLGINSRGDLYIFPGKGSGKFYRRWQVGSGWSGWQLYAAGDLNKDGKNDILGINSRGDLYQFWGKGTGRFFPRQSAGSGWTGWTLAGGADLTGDGKADILGRSSANGNLYIFRGLGHARFASRQLVDQGWGPTALRTSVYGTSGEGRALTVYKIVNPAATRIERRILLVFEQHGFEDSYARDGQILVDTAQAAVTYFVKNAATLGTTELDIVPSANPDGLIDGWTNMGPGRCVIVGGIDMNRDWDASFLANRPGRNHTGPGAFGATETRALRDLITQLSAPVPITVLDIHGWENDILAADSLYAVIGPSFWLRQGAHGFVGGTASSPASSGFLALWVQNQMWARGRAGDHVGLVEFKPPLYRNPTPDQMSANVAYYSQQVESAVLALVRSGI